MQARAEVRVEEADPWLALEANGVDNLASLREVPRLQLVEIEMKNPPSLVPLVGHAGIRGVWIVGGNRPADEVEALLDSPLLRMVNVTRRSWIRTNQSWEHIADIYSMSPDQKALYEHALGELNAMKA